jgi:hypothetical protein
MNESLEELLNTRDKKVNGFLSQAALILLNIVASHTSYGLYLLSETQVTKNITIYPCKRMLTGVVNEKLKRKKKSNKQPEMLQK